MFVRRFVLAMPVADGFRHLFEQERAFFGTHVGARKPIGHLELWYRETDDQQNAQTKRQIVRHGSKPWGEARAATEWSLNSFHGRLVAPECQANGPIPARRSVQPIQPDSCWP